MAVIPISADAEKTRVALDALDALCDIWADEVQLRAMCALIAGDAEKVEAMMRLAFVEGAYRSFLAANPEARE